MDVYMDPHWERCDHMAVVKASSETIEDLKKVLKEQGMNSSTLRVGSRIG